MFAWAVRITLVIFLVGIALLCPSSTPHTARAADYALPQAASAEVWQLSSTSPSDREAGIPIISPDNRWVVYGSTLLNSNLSELLRVPITGGASVRLNGALATGGSIGPSAISPDSSWVLYTARQVGDATNQLYRVPLAGGNPVRLNSTLPGNTFVSSFMISPNGSRIVYTTDQDFSQTAPSEIYSVPIVGGTAVKLNSPLTGQQRVVTAQISPNSSRVIYELGQGPISSDPASLYSVPLAGGAPIKLDDPFARDAAHSFQITPDSSRVVYSRQPQPADPTELYQVPLAGGTPAKIARPAGVNVSPYFELSSDSQRVVFRVSNNSGTSELYSTPLANGGTTVKLNRPLETTAKVLSSRISPDASRVIYTADHGSFTQAELYSVPIAGGASATLNGALDPDGIGVDLQIHISPDSRRVVYVADQQANDFSPWGQLYSAPLAGGSAAVKINGPLISGGAIAVPELWFTPDGKHVLYRAEGTTEDLYDLFITSVDTIDARKINDPLPPMVAGEPISSDQGYINFVMSPNGRYVVFRGAQAREGIRALYGAVIAEAQSLYLPLVQR